MTSVFKPVFIDASSAILLEKSELFHCISNIFQLFMAPSVFTEITASDHKGALLFKTFFDQGAFKVTTLSCETNDPDLCCPKNFGQGEKDTIRLYHGTKLETRPETQKGFILIDDGPAAKWCASQNIPFINALLVPKVLLYANLITTDDCMGKMDLLCRIGRYSNKIKEIAFAFTHKDLSFFLPE